MLKLVNYLLVQNENENTKYKILSDLIFGGKKRRYLELENEKTGEQKTVEISYYIGKERLLVREEVLSNVDISPRFLFARIIGDCIVVENKNFVE